MPERLNGAVSKIVVRESVPGVQIPLSPPDVGNALCLLIPLAHLRPSYHEAVLSGEVKPVIGYFFQTEAIRAILKSKFPLIAIFMHSSLMEFL